MERDFAVERDGTGHEPFRADDLNELLRLLARTDIEELELEYEGSRVRIRRDPTLPDVGPVPDGGQENEPHDEPFVVSSPLVGVFRRSPGGSADRPVEEGDSVGVGQAVGAVEAMRILNRVQTEHSGVVDKLLVEEGQAVEYGQPLLVLRRT